MQQNPSLWSRGLFKGSLKSSIIAELQSRDDSAAPVGQLVACCGVTRRAMHEALADLEFSALVRRQRKGRTVLVHLQRAQVLRRVG